MKMIENRKRIYSYTQPFEHLMENPIYFFLGEASVEKKLLIHQLLKEMSTEVKGQITQYSPQLIMPMVYLLVY